MRRSAASIKRYIKFVSGGKFVVLVSTKAEAARIHAALKRLNVGRREGDTWKIGAGSIEVRT